MLFFVSAAISCVTPHVIAKVNSSITLQLVSRTHSSILYGAVLQTEVPWAYASLLVWNLLLRLHFPVASGKQ